MVERAIAELTHAYLEGEITADELAELRDRLAADSAARRAFIITCMQTRLMRETLDPDRLAAVEGLDTAASSDSDQTSEMTTTDTTPIPTLRPARSLRYAFALAAALLIAAGVTALVIFNRPPAPEHHIAAPVALLSNVSDDARFGPSSVPTAIGSDLPPGRISLTAGSAQVLLHRGAVVDLYAPCTFDVVGENTARLAAGEVHAYVPNTAHGFTLAGPAGASVVDLGTEFNMIVADADTTHVEVLRGQVQFRTPDEAVLMTAGRIARYSPGESGIHWVTADDNAFTRSAAGRAPILILSDPADGLLSMHHDGAITRNDTGGLSAADQPANLRYDRIGSADDNSDARQDAFLFFALPKLTRIAQLDRAAIRIDYLARDFSPHFNIDVYGLPGRDTTAVPDSDFYCGPLDTANPRLADDLITPNLPTGVLTVTGPALTDYLRKLYDPGGTPRVKFAVIRLSPDVEKTGRGWPGYVIGFNENRPDFKPASQPRVDQYVHGYDLSHIPQPPALIIPRQ